MLYFPAFMPCFLFGCCCACRFLQKAIWESVPYVCFWHKAVCRLCVCHYTSKNLRRRRYACFLQCKPHDLYGFFDHPLYFLELTLGPNARTPPDYLQNIIDPIPFWSDYRNYTMLRVNAWLQFLSLGSSYYVHAVVWQFLSFTGLWVFTAHLPHFSR